MVRNRKPAAASCSPVTVATPLRIEARALRPTLAGTPLLRTGMGPRRAGEAARGWADRLESGTPQDFPPGMAIAGFCAGLGAGLNPGDVVVPSELWGAGGPIPLPSSALLAGALARQGLRVHRGPVISVDRIISGAERARLRATGAIAADMESAFIAAAIGQRPTAVARVVVDTADHDLGRPRTLTRGLHAFRVLRATGPALVEWAAAVGSREARLAAPRSFCAGVERAIHVVESALEQRGAPIYVRKQIVHNVHVVRDLEQRGAVFVEELDEVPEGATVIFSAHGVSPAVRAAADRRHLDVIDASCPLVTKVHSEARRFADRGNTVVLIGHAGHEEVEGTLGEAPDQAVLVETPDDARSLAVEDEERVTYLMQTTLAVDEAEEVAGELRQRFPSIVGPSSDDICYATTNRQRAVRSVADGADLLLVLGSANSSNSKRLAEIGERCGVTAHLVDDTTEVDLTWLAGTERLAITAGASAPPYLVSDLVETLRGLGPVEVNEQPVATEPARFALPKEVQQP